jgi:methionine-rich copper-binding protein CopC
MANAAKIANFLVTAGETLKGAGGDKVTAASAGDAILKSLVNSVNSAGSTGVIDLGNASLLTTVLTDSAKEVAKTVTGTTDNFAAKITAMAATVASVIKDATDNITAIVATGGSSDTLLTSVGNVSKFTQEGASAKLQDIAKTLDPANATAILASAVTSLTGDAADKSISKGASAPDPVVLVVPVPVVPDVVYPPADTTPPATPVLALGTGVLYGATETEAKAAGGVVTVSSESGASTIVTFTHNSNSVSKTVTGTGSAVAVVLTSDDLVTLGNGTISVSAIATDSSNNTSSAGTSSFILDTVTPSGNLSAVIDNVGLIQGGLISGSTTDDTTLQLSGTNESSSKVDIYDGQTKLGAAAVNGTTWTYELTLNKATTYVKVIEEDAAGNRYPDSSGTLFQITKDITVPTLSSSSPSDGATAVAITSEITLTFSESVRAGTGNIVITNSVTNTPTSIPIGSSQVSISGSTITINPTSDLTAGYDYNVQLASGVLTDLAGNAFAGISDATTLNFTTVPNGTTASPVTTGTSGNDIINGNQGTVSSTPIQFDASTGKDWYVFKLDPSTNSVSSGFDSHIAISGFGSGDKLIFDTTETALIPSVLDDLKYGVNDNPTTGKIDITCVGTGADAHIQHIILTGLTSSRPAALGSGNTTIDSFVELNTYLAFFGASIEII